MLQFPVEYYHPVVRLPGNFQTMEVCYCGRWACHPKSLYCANHIDYSKLKELYPYPSLRGTLEDQELTKFHFWLSTKGGTRSPVHLEYNPGHLEDFKTSENPDDVRKDMVKSTQHLINIMKDKKIVEGGKDTLEFKAKETR